MKAVETAVDCLASVLFAILDLNDLYTIQRVIIFYYSNNLNFYLDFALTHLRLWLFITILPKSPTDIFLCFEVMTSAT